MDDAELAAVIKNYLDGHSVLNLATSGPQGAHAASLFYARREFDLYWFSENTTRHSLDLARAVGCAGTITDNVDDYRLIQGLQLQGVGEKLVDTGERETGLDALVKRFSFLRDFMAGEGAARMATTSIYRFRPLSITWIDNSVSFGFKQTLEF